MHKKEREAQFLTIFVIFLVFMSTNRKCVYFVSECSKCHNKNPMKQYSKVEKLCESKAANSYDHFRIL